MQKPARRHHTVSRFYLEEFACDHRKGRLLVLDALKRVPFSARPADLTIERDFNRIDAADTAPDTLEVALGQMESEFSSAIRRTVLAKRFESEDDKFLIANFAALLLIRNPRLRSRMARMYEDISKLRMQAQVSSEKRWRHLTDRMKADGYLTEGNDVSYEQMRDYVRGGEYDVRFPREHFIAQEIKLLESVPQLVAKRNWAILDAEAATGGFITCDHPASLVWSEPKKHASPYGPGLGLRGTELLLPLSPAVGLVGAFELEDSTIKVSAEVVAKFNGITAMSARRQVYCYGPEAMYQLEPEGRPKSCAALLNDTRFKAERLPKVPWY